MHQDPETPETEPELCLSVSCRSAGHQWPATGAGAPGAGALGQMACGISLLRGVTINPPRSHRADDPQTAEQLYQRNSRTVQKVLGPTTDFPTRESGKGLRTPRECDFRGQWDLITELTQDSETVSWRAQTNPCAHRPREEEAVTPQETGPDLPVCVQQAPAELRARAGLLQGRGPECSHARLGPSAGGHHSFSE